LKSAAEKEYATKPKSKADTGCVAKGHCEGQETVKGSQLSQTSTVKLPSTVKPPSTSESPFTTKISVPLTSSTTEKIVLSSSSKGSEGTTQRKQIDEKIVRTSSSDMKTPPATLSSTDEENVKRSAAKLAIQKNAARAAFFSSLNTPPTSPSEEKRDSPESRVSPARTTMDYTVRISPCRSSISGTTKYIVKDNTTVVKSSSTATRPTAKVSFSSPSSSSSDSSPSPNSPISSSARISNIPRFTATKPELESREKYTYQKEATIQKPSILKSSPSVSNPNPPSKDVPQLTMPVVQKSLPSEIPPNQEGMEKTDVKPKRIPPPPPPRKSSKLLRSAPVSGLVSPRGSEEIKPDIHDSTIVAGNNEGTVKSGTTCTSTPKPAIPQKPSRVARGRTVTDQSGTTKIESTGTEKSKRINDNEGKSKLPDNGVKLKLSDELGRDDRESSIDSSASSSSSGESQQSVIEKDKQTVETSASTSLNGGPSTKKPKPPPPIRKSSLADSYEEKLDNNRDENGKKS
jgi:hypothetical protein